MEEVFNFELLIMNFELLEFFCFKLLEPPCFAKATQDKRINTNER